MHKYKILAKDECGELFNSKLLFLTTKKQPTSKENIPENWKDLRKFFKINKRFTYTDTKTNIKFINRFQKMEVLLKDNGHLIEESSLELMDKYWEQAKKFEK